MRQLIKAKLGGSMDYKYGCLPNQKEVNSKKYIHMLLHISILRLNVRLEEYKLNKVKSISHLPYIYRLSP